MTGANGSSRPSSLNPDSTVRAFAHDRREWTYTRLADVKPDQEFIADNCLHKVLRPDVYATFPVVDVAKIPEADRPYDPRDWRSPKGRDVVYAYGSDGSILGHRLLANLDPGQKCVFQGLIYHIKPGPTPGTGKLVGHGEVDHRPDHRQYVWLEYKIDDPMGKAEVVYRYPEGRRIPLTNGGSVPVEALTPGTDFLLEDGGSAKVTGVSKAERWEPEREVLDDHGNGFRRVVGTFKFTGWVQLMTVTVGGLVHKVTPGHRYWSETRQGWYPIDTFRVGELVQTEERRSLPIEALTHPQVVHTTVYNFEVDEFHTYFVGRDTTAVWSHNGMGGAGCGVPKAASIAQAEKEVLALRVAEAINTGKPLPAEYTALNLRTRQRVMQIAQEHIDEGLRHGNAAASAEPVIGYRLESTIDDSVQRYGITKDFKATPHGVKQSRYSQEFLDQEKLRFVPLTGEMPRPRGLSWERLMISSYHHLNGEMPPRNPVFR
jgi:hypothetical protein